MEILVTREAITPETLAELAQQWHIAMVKGVTDVETGVVALGGEWHMDANTRLIEAGSSQANLWGFNIYPKETGDRAIEYISLINIRPAQNNRSMELMDPALRAQVRKTVSPIVPFLQL